MCQLRGREPAQSAKDAQRDTIHIITPVTQTQQPAINRMPYLLIIKLAPSTIADSLEQNIVLRVQLTV